MPFSDLFKKSTKKGPVQTPQGRAAKPSTDESFLSPEMQKKRYDAAMEFLKNFQERMPLVDGKPHAGTVLSAVARLAGTSLYRSLNYNNNAAPGTVVLSNEVNEAWPQLMNLFAYYCKQNGIDVMSKPTVTQFPERYKPLMTVEQVQQEYQDQYNEVMQKHGLDHLNGARAGMVVCSIIFQYHCATAKDIDPFVAAGIVAMGIVEGAKTAPPPLGTKSVARKEDGVKNNNRLVLGEDGAVMKETRENGGVSIIVNPGTLQLLKQGNIDPYLIYEKALLNQIEAKIPRIDFIDSDVDKLYGEWKQKSPNLAPIHVRLLMWLKDNSATHKYVQDGNSWVLKS